MTVENKAPEIRLQGFSRDWQDKKIGSILAETKRPVELLDNELYQLVTVKRRNEGVVPRAILKGKDILVKNYYGIKAGDYLISKRQVVHGANGIVPESLDNAVVSNEYLVVTDNDEITAKFWTVVSKRPEMHKLFFISSYGVDIEKLVFDVTDWKNRAITIPDVAEQKSITDYFQQLDSLVIQHQKKHDKLKNIKKAMLDKMFPKQGKTIPEIRFKGFAGEWGECSIGDMTNCFSGGTPSVGVEAYYRGDIPFIRSAEINKTSTEINISEAGLENSSAKIVEVGTLLYALYGATSGEVGRSKVRGAINQAILAIIPKAGICSEFLSHWLRKSKNDILSRYLQGGQGNLSGDIVKNLIVQLPDFDEQRAIGIYFQKLDTLINQHQQQITKLNNIKQACLRKMFV
ncbi:MAG: restriction endonuclease subunit S [Agarilytica sp.]